MKALLHIPSILFALYLSIPSAIAGDFSTREILGFSEDGALFAFEEYGVQDGSGFPYSTIFIINTANDSWVNGSPFRARLDDEQADITQVRQRARTMAGDGLAAITQPGVINATNQPLEIIDDPMRMVARPWHFVPPTSDRMEFRIEALPMSGRDFCNPFGQVYGFRLKQLFLEDGGTTKTLHEDSEIPQSRGCPLSYRFADIVTYRVEATRTMITAILVLYETVVFEGPDGRYMAVTYQTLLD
ncbi:MAG: DUF2259 domain-containing protein [Salaquimonas sp.]